METRRTRGKRIKYDVELKIEPSDASDSNDPENLEDMRKSRIRDSNKEYARRMTILQTWSQYWSDYTTREGDAYPKKEALNILKKSKKIFCPIETCRKAFTTFGGLRYHYARCNIERCFKCMVCNPPLELKTKGDLLRHMVRTHHNDLPQLEGEQKEIANSYLTSTGRNEKSKKKSWPGDQETQMNCRGIVKSYYDMIDKTFEPEIYLKRPFKDWQTLLKDWELLTSETGRFRYYPPERESPHIKTATQQWCTLRIGESIILNNISGNTTTTTTTNNNNIETLLQPPMPQTAISAQQSYMENVIFFTGGVSTSAAWLPKPFFDKQAECLSDLLAVSVNSCAMDKSLYYKDCKDLEGCVQFWTMQISTTLTETATSATKESNCMLTKPKLSFMVGHKWGNIFEMTWCPLGTSWELPMQIENEIKATNDQSLLSRVGLLALACGDGNIRIISVPHKEQLLQSTLANTSSSFVQYTGSDLIDSIPMFRVKPVACLSPPGAGQSTDYQTPSCTSLCWNLEDNQKLLVAGYSNGNVALFDLSNYSPILYTSIEHYHIYRPYRTWFAHGLPVSGVALLSSNLERTLVATGSRDRQLKLWNSMDLNTCLASDRSPITRVVWDYRFRGIVTSTEAAFTSFQNRVSYRYPTMDSSNTTITIATHRATVWGLNSSIITSSLVTSDEAGEVFIAIYGRPIQKKDRNPLSTHCVFTILPSAKQSTNNNTALLQQQNHHTSLDSYRTFVDVKNKNNNNSNNQIITNTNSNRMNSTIDANQKCIQSGDDIIGTSDDLIITGPINVDNTNVGASADGGGEHALELDLDENNEDNDQEDVYGYAERPVANKPARFLLPIDHRAVETFGDFKQNFGLEFIQYDQTYPRSDQKLPESCVRANDLTKIYCDRVCDYPFSSIKHVSFSPNTNSFPYLLSVSHVGLCRIDKVKIIDQIYRNHVDALSSALLQKHQLNNNQQMPIVNNNTSDEF